MDPPLAADVKCVDPQMGLNCALHAINNVLQRMVLTQEQAHAASKSAGNNRSTYWSDDDVRAMVKRANAVPVQLETKTDSDPELRRAWMLGALRSKSLVGFIELSGKHGFAHVHAQLPSGEMVHVKVRMCASGDLSIPIMVS